MTRLGFVRFAPAIYGVEAVVESGKMRLGSVGHAIVWSVRAPFGKAALALVRQGMERSAEAPVGRAGLGLGRL